jgi:hypothetical protein
MKNKKTLRSFIVALSIIFCLQSSQAIAQRVGLIGGLNLANVSAKEDGNDLSDMLDKLEGFHLGLIVEIPLQELLTLEPGIIAEIKGFKYEENDGSYEYILREYLLFTDIPVNLKLRIPLGLLKPYAEAGPYIGFGTYGKSWITEDGDDESEDIEWGGDDGDYKRFDWGFNFGAGVEIGRVIIGASYGLGMADISNMGDVEIKNRVIRVTVGVKLGQAKEMQ